MVLRRSAPARRCASAAVSSGSTATGAAWGWRDRNVKVRSSTMTARITTTTSRAPRLFFIVRESAATALGRQGARGDDSSITLRCMISSFDYGDVRYFRMARAVLGRAIYWTGVYLIDGLLVDSGPPNLAHDVRRLVSNLAVRQCVTTHHHEDHSGNHGLLAAELRITPLAHAIGVSRLAVADTHSQLYRRVAWGARLRDKLDFLVELGERIHELHGRGWSDAAIARALPGSDFLWRVWTGGDFSKRNFVRAFLRTASAR